MACRMIISPGVVKVISILFSKIKKGKIKKLNLYNFIFCTRALFTLAIGNPICAQFAQR